MATLTIEKLDASNKLRFVTGKFVFDTSYPTGGETVDFGLRSVYVAVIAPASGYVLEYDATNKKVKAFYADYDATADGALIEVPNLTNLSAVTARFIVVGE